MTVEKKVISIIAVYLAIFAVYEVHKRFRDSIGVDYYQFWVMAQAVSKGETNNIYSTKDKITVGKKYLQKSQSPEVSARQKSAAIERYKLEIYATPFLYTIIGFLITGSYETDLLIFQSAGLIIFLVSIALLCWKLNLSNSYILLILAAFLLFFEPLIADMRVGNVGQIQLGILIYFIMLSGGRGLLNLAAPGMVLGILLMFKPTVLFVVFFYLMWFFVHGRYNEGIHILIGFGAGVVLPFIISVIYFGSIQSWIDWMNSVLALAVMDRNFSVDMGNFSITRLIFDKTGHDISFILILLLVVSICCVIWFTRSKSKQLFGIDITDKNKSILFFRESILLSGIGICTLLLAGQLVWIHYYLLLIPSGMYLMFPARKTAGSGTSLDKVTRFSGLTGLFLISGPPAWYILNASDTHQMCILFTMGTLLIFLFSLREVLYFVDDV